MKIGMNLLLWTTHVTPEHFPVLAELKKAGFDGVELPIFEGDLNHVRRNGAELKKQGLRATAVTVAAPEANPASSDPAIRQAAVERLKWVVDAMHAFGGETLCGPYHSPLGVFSGAGPTA